MVLYRSTKKISLKTSPMDISFDVDATGGDFTIGIAFSTEALEGPPDYTKFFSAFLIDTTGDEFSKSKAFSKTGNVVYTTSPDTFEGKKYLVEDGKAYIQITADDVRGLKDTSSVKTENGLLYNYDGGFKVLENRIGLDTAAHKPLSFYSLVDNGLVAESHFFGDYGEMPELSGTSRIKLTVFDEILVSLKSSDGLFRPVTKLGSVAPSDETYYVYLIVRCNGNPDDFVKNLTISV